MAVRKERMLLCLFVVPPHRRVELQCVTPRNYNKTFFQPLYKQFPASWILFSAPSLATDAKLLLTCKSVHVSRHLTEGNILFVFSNLLVNYQC